MRITNSAKAQVSVIRNVIVKWEQFSDDAQVVGFTRG